MRLFLEQGYERTTVAQIAAAADVDPKTFFNYFGTKDEVLSLDVERSFDRLVEVIADRRPGEAPGDLLARAIREFRAQRWPEVPPQTAEERSAIWRLALATPAIQAKGAYLLIELQGRMAEELVRVYAGELDPVTAAAMTGALIGAIQHVTATGVRLGRSQHELWADAERAAEVALHGLLSIRPEGPEGEGNSDDRKRPADRS